MSVATAQQTVVRTKDEAVVVDESQRMEVSVTREAEARRVAEEVPVESA